VSYLDLNGPASAVSREWREIIDSLRFIYTPGERLIWLNSPQKLLDGRRPVDCKAEEVWRLLRQLLDGAYL
jgi:hypothetical protein